ncbi:SRPBCC family protein [Deinococcus peraridilitoris]|uniref:Putative integral membrane protein n=1 Tax=Deinococcus peraridilitoris (strain DSM 19664 / LMG 22246 / CIP 109416 / KR-200) TaxID=937777 RepID=L0A1K9_DEIPD|nr:SRPBCC family protein [Deinococcus peraridilitoris]AFZ66900.1 putative integral membrane protein [Deinococcus peraridilitoris DSM 19664]
MTQQKAQRAGQQFTDSPQNMSGVERSVFGALGLGLLVLGVRQRSALGAGLGLLGAVVTAGAALGRSPYNAAIRLRRTNEAGGIHVQQAITIGRPVDELYAFWRSLENLPRFMSHLESVHQREDGSSHWVAKAPAGSSVSWDAQITEEVPGRLIAWKATEDAQVPNEGRVEFRAAPGGRGTEVRVELQYFPPGGTLGAGIARLFGQESGQQIHDDLMRLKRLMEVGFEPTTEGQSSGRAKTQGHVPSDAALSVTRLPSNAEDQNNVRLLGASIGPEKDQGAGDSEAGGTA